MWKSLWVSLAQVTAAAVIAYLCIAASSIAADASDGETGIGDGLVYIVAALLLVPIGTMITGSMIARRIGMASPGLYCLSVVAVVLVVLLGWSSPSLIGNEVLLAAALVAANLLIGFGTGMRPVDPAYEAVEPAS